MTASLRLSRDELAEVSGSRQRARQVAWCRANGIPVTEDCMGRPVVLRAALEAKLMPKGGTRTAARTEPDLGALVRPRAA
jgi:hypothetical protein